MIIFFIWHQQDDTDNQEITQMVTQDLEFKESNPVAAATWRKQQDKDICKRSAGVVQQVEQVTHDLKFDSLHPVAAGTRAHIFSCVRPFYERAVSDLDRSIHRSLWVQVAHRSFIEGSPMTKNTAPGENIGEKIFVGWTPVLNEYVRRLQTLADKF